jgi:hypothetical protein
VSDKPDTENPMGGVYWYRRSDGITCRVEVTEFHWERGYTVHNLPVRVEDTEGIARVMMEQIKAFAEATETKGPQ